MQSSESLKEMERVLREERVGYLGLSRDGSPYVIPLNYCYIDGKIVFHCAHEGKKLDSLRSNPRVCFTVGRQSGGMTRHPQGASCHTDADSVVCYGMGRIVEDKEERRIVLNEFNRRFEPAAEEITEEAASTCCAVEIAVEEMTGRRQREGMELARWSHRFRE